MNLTRTWKVVLAAAVGVAALVAGGAVAATKLMSPGERSQAIVNDAAKQLGVEPAKLSAALKKAVENQVDAEVAAGRITKEQGDALKQRIEVERVSAARRAADAGSVRTAASAITTARSAASKPRPRRTSA